MDGDVPRAFDLALQFIAQSLVGNPVEQHARGLDQQAAAPQQDHGGPDDPEATPTEVTDFGNRVAMGQREEIAIQRVGATSAAQASLLGPLSTIAMSIFILDEPFTPWIAVGTVLVIGSISILARKPAPAR